MKSFYTAALGLLLLGTSVHITSCLKKDYDAPPDNRNFDPGLPVTHTIAQVQEMQQGVKIDSNVVISGVVVMDDKSGNYYKKIVIQDTSGGIEILVDQNNLYNDYPIGRKVYVKCKGLYVGNYGSNLQIGFTPDANGGLSNIPAVTSTDHIIKANYPNTITPDTLTLEDLKSPTAAKKHLNTLVAIKNVEFASNSSGVPYAQLASLSSATNRTINDCNGETITLRTSGYAKFQPLLTPTGNGTIVGIYTRFNTTPQLYIRDTTDLNFVNDRCGGGNNPTPTVELLVENFNSATSGVINLTGWVNFSQTGTQKYVFAGNSNAYAKISAYQTGQSVVKSWLVTPNVSLAGQTKAAMTVRTTYGFPQSETLKAYISTNFTGSDPTTATWTELSAVTTPGQGNWAWKDHTVVLDSYVGQNIRIAFVYDGGDPGKTGTYEIDDLKILGDK